MGSSGTVAVTRKIPESGLQLLREATTVEIWDQELPPSPDEIDALLEGCDGAITLLTDRIDGAVLDRHPSLRVVSNFAVGYDNIDVPAASERGVLVCNTPEVLTNATADHTWALLLAASQSRYPTSGTASGRPGVLCSCSAERSAGRRSVLSDWDESAKRSQNALGDLICASSRSTRSKMPRSRGNMT